MNAAVYEIEVKGEPQSTVTFVGKVIRGDRDQHAAYVRRGHGRVAG